MTSKAEAVRRKKALTQWIVQEGLTTTKLADIQVRIRQDAPAAAEGWVPDVATLWRWLESLKAADVAPPRTDGDTGRVSNSALDCRDTPASPTANGGDTPRTDMIVAAGANVARLTDVPPWPAELTRQATRETMIRDIERLAARAAALLAALTRLGPLPNAVRAMAKVQAKYLARMERGAKTLRGKFSDDGVRIRYEQMRDFNHQLLRALNDAPTPLEHINSAMNRAPRRLPTAGGVMPAVGNALEVAARRPSLMPFADTVADRQLGPEGLVVVAPREPWGVALARAPRPHYGAVIEGSTENSSETHGLLRALLLAPVLTAGLSCGRAAELWNKHFRRQTTAEEELLLPSLPAELEVEARARYHNIHVKTLEKWQRRVRLAEQQQANEARIRDDVRTDGISDESEAIASSDAPNMPPSACALRIPSVLAHRNATDRRRRRALTPAMEAYIRQQYLMQHPDESPSTNAYALISVVKVSSTTICYELKKALHVEISPRTVQRFIAECVSDAERIRLRGGPAAAEIFRTRFIRQATRPNQIWVMDHSFFRRERLDDAHPEWAPRSRDDIHFACAFERESHSVGAVASRRIVKKMSMTAIMDACTRRRLVLRVWENTPSTEETLAAIRDAILQFGVPEMLYTDNGSDLTSKRVLHVLTGLGIRKVHSMPYCPQGRGLIERDFRTIKEEVLPLMPGFVHGSDTKRVDPSRLQDHATFEQDLWRRVDLRFNYRTHDETGQQPAVHYDNAMGGRRLIVPTEEQLVALLSVQRDVVRHSDGLHVLGGRYSGPALDGIAVDTLVRLYVDPYRPAVGYVAAPDHQGRQRFVGVVERYGQGAAAAPQYDTQLAIEAAWKAESEHALAARARVVAARAAQVQLAAQGDARAAQLYSDIEAARRELPAATSGLVLAAAPDDGPLLLAAAPAATTSTPASSQDDVGVRHQMANAPRSARADDTSPSGITASVGRLDGYEDVGDGRKGRAAPQLACTPDSAAEVSPASGCILTGVAIGLVGEIASLPRTPPPDKSLSRTRGDANYPGNAGETTRLAPKPKGTARPRSSALILPWAAE